MMSEANEKPNLMIRVFRSLLPWVIGGALFGFAIGVAEGALGWDLSRFVKSILPEFKLESSAVTAMVLGGLLIAVAGVVGIGALWPKAGLKLKVFADIQDWEDQGRLYRLSAVGCFAWGGLLVLLAVAMPLDLPRNMGFLLGLGFLAVVLVYSCWQLIAEFDELWHEINQTSCTWAFYGALVVGGGWSAFAHLGLITQLSPLDWISLLSGLSLIGAVIANGRRGLLEEHM